MVDAPAEPRSRPYCNRAAAAHIDVRFNGSGSANTDLIGGTVCPEIPPGPGGDPPLVGEYIARTIARGTPNDVVPGVMFMLESSDVPPVLPRFDPARPHEEQSQVIAARAALMAQFQQSRAEQQAWVVDAITSARGRVRQQVALANLVVADVSVGLLRELVKDGRFAAIGNGAIDDFTGPSVNGEGRSVLDGRQQMLADQLYGRGYTGSSYRLGVIDGGVTASHDLLTTEVDLNEDCTSTIGGICFGADPTDCNESQGGSHGHGTSVAALAGANNAFGVGYAGVADSTLDTWKVSESVSFQGSTICEITPATIAVAFENAIIYDDVINASISTTPTTDPVEELASQTAANEAYQAGAIVIAGSGNFGEDGTETVGAPGSADNVIAVGAVEADGQLAQYSSLGPADDGRIKPDISAPTDLITACAADNICTTTFNGTSAASPMAAGVAAQLLDVYESNGGWGGAPASVVAGRIYATLIAFGSPLNGANADPDNDQGAGLLQLGDTVCSRWRWGSLPASDTGDGSTTIHIPPGGAENIRLAFWWTDLANTVIDFGHADIDLRLVKGGTSHVSDVPGSSFQRLLIDSLSPGTWTIEANWAGGTGNRTVHYFWYNDEPDIACVEASPG